MNRPAVVVLTVAAFGILIAPSSPPLLAQGQGGGTPEWVSAVRHDTSRPLREMPPRPAVSTRQDFTVKQAPPTPQAGQPDQAVQSFVLAPLSATTGAGFDGIGEGNPQFAYNVNSAPPWDVPSAVEIQRRLG